MSKCICGEINARHCPVHNDPPKPREWWIASSSEDIILDHAPDHGDAIHVIEYSAFEQLREENEQLKLQIQKERRKSEAEIERLNRDVSSWSHKAAQHRAEADSLKLMAESFRAKLANLVDAITSLDETYQASRQYLRKAIVEARKALEGK